RNLVEGITEYLTQQVLRRRYVMGSRRWVAYAEYVRFAAAIVEHVGYRALTECVFHTGFFALEGRIDGVGGPGTTSEAARALQEDDLGDALASLSKRPH